MKTFTEIENYFDKLISQNNKDIAEVEKVLADSKTVITQQEKELQEAEATVDYERYDKAKKELWTAKNKKELADKRLEKLTSFPLVDREEYDYLIGLLKKATDEEEENLKQETISILGQLKDIAERDRESKSKLTELLEKLDNNIGKNYEVYKKREDGAILSERFSGLAYGLSRAPELALFCEETISSPILKK